MADTVRRRAVVCAVAIAVTATSCTGPSTSPTTTTPSATAPPITATPLDVAAHLAEPCAGVPTDLTAQLGLPQRKDAHDTVLVGAGDQSECRLSSGPPLSAAAEVRFYAKARPLPLVTGPGSQIKPTTVAGYPAGEWVLSKGEDGSFTSCQVIVDVAPSQGLATLYNGPSSEPVTASCAKATQLVEGVLTALRR
ncbi:Protein of unknown function [Amycolatopsis pretoriensis]|uniref:DUF3558 domain-containing protein n=1 Tax=Amycolatopsis pretoriensis TaxID=218821 RepID=A0A1H5RFG6_9PSEU|nr:DUF3558 family protein [Amycolatopsis pretoriensis]SEF37136.1 Protein of unknown function [Amycolatopsis pretoriensis]